jgi:hypothetical protein
MKRFKRLALTVAALAALAVGGAAFAQAQNAGTVANTQVETRSVETGTPTDPADGPGATDQNKADGNVAGEQEDGPEAKADKPDAAGEKDSPDGPNDQQGQNDHGGQED